LSASSAGPQAGAKVFLRAGRDRRVPELVLERRDLFGLLARPDFHDRFPRREFVRHAVERNPLGDALLELGVKVARDRGLEQVYAIVGRGDGVRLLGDELPAVVEPRKRTRDGERVQQSDQREHGSLDGRQSRDAAFLPSQIAQPQDAPEVQQDQ
jgi:hypothetical protein